MSSSISALWNAPGYRPCRMVKKSLSIWSEINVRENRPPTICALSTGKVTCIRASSVSGLLHELDGGAARRTGQRLNLVTARSPLPIFQYASTPAEGARACPVNELHFESPPNENDDANEAIGESLGEAECESCVRKGLSMAKLPQKPNRGLSSCTDARSTISPQSMTTFARHEQRRKAHLSLYRVFENVIEEVIRPRPFSCSTRKRRATEIDSDERLSDDEENRCDKCAQYEVVPGYRRVGQDFVDRCEQ
jgi:hypothetical protein